MLSPHKEHNQDIFYLPFQLENIDIFENLNSNGNGNDNEINEYFMIEIDLIHNVITILSNAFENETKCHQYKLDHTHIIEIERIKIGVTLRVDDKARVCGIGLVKC